VRCCARRCWLCCFAAASGAIARPPLAPPPPPADEYFKNTVDGSSSWERPTAPAAGAGAGAALPAGWVSAWTDEGCACAAARGAEGALNGASRRSSPLLSRRHSSPSADEYFKNTVDGSSSWERPTAPAAGAGGGLPAGWSEEKTADGYTYYLNTDGTSSWERPT
jgi:hypothetical protein